MFKKQYPPMDYVDRIIDALNRSGKNQRGLSLAIGKDLTAANKIIGRIRKMQDNEFAPAAQYLGVTVNWLLTGEEKPIDGEIKYSQLIARLIWDASAKGKKPSTAVQEEMQRLLNVMIDGDMKRGLEIDLERYRLFIQSIQKEKK